MEPLTKWGFSGSSGYYANCFPQKMLCFLLFFGGYNANWFSQNWLNLTICFQAIKAYFIECVFHLTLNWNLVYVILKVTSFNQYRQKSPIDSKVCRRYDIFELTGENRQNRQKSPDCGGYDIFELTGEPLWESFPPSRRQNLSNNFSRDMPPNQT